jgi:hypothetical protein
MSDSTKSTATYLSKSVIILPSPLVGQNHRIGIIMERFDILLCCIVCLLTCPHQVDAQNKFMGKSFEIRPTGVAHAELLLPEDWAPDYPKCTAAGIQGKVVEHFSWKKVTTNVSGFILGSPTIDHYGDMIVSEIFCPLRTLKLKLHCDRSRIIGLATSVY